MVRSAVQFGSVNVCQAPTVCPAVFQITRDSSKQHENQDMTFLSLRNLRYGQEDTPVFI